MALITLTGDSDGDLHTAALHNSKFGAIASVLNGNVDLDNLSKPKSTGILRFGLNGYRNATIDADQEFYQLASATAGTINGLGWLNSGSGDSVLVKSWIRIPTAITLVSAVIIYPTATVNASGENFNVYLQKSSSTTITDAYTTMGTFTDDFYASIGINQSTISLSPSTVGANYYMRVVVENPASFAGTAKPPIGFQIIVHYKTDHTA